MPYTAKSIRVMKATMKVRTIDEVCNKPPGSFQKFVEQKRKFLQSIESERKERIRATKKSARELSWAA